MSKNIFAVQSYCFRGFKDNATLAGLVKKIGLSNVELCAVHVDFNKPDTFDTVIKTYRDAGVGIVSIGVEGISTDETAARNRFNFAQKAGAKFMSVSFPIRDAAASMALAEKLADEYDISLGIHNHGGFDWLGSFGMLKHVFATTGPRIGLCLDTAWAHQTGRSVAQFLEHLGSRLRSLHVKDFVYGRDGKWQDVVIGTGNLDLPKLKAELDKLNFTGPLILEYEGDVNDPTPALAQCVEVMKKTF